MKESKETINTPTYSEEDGVSKVVGSMAKKILEEGMEKHGKVEIPSLGITIETKPSAKNSTTLHQYSPESS